MRKIKILSFILVFLTLVGCSPRVHDSLKGAHENGQYVLIDYYEFETKIKNDDDFVFFVRKSDCSSCEMFYPVVANVLDDNSDLKIYTLLMDDLESSELIVMASYFYSVIGSEYYAEHEFQSHILYSPSIVSIIDGEFKYAKIGVQSEEELLKFYQSNYFSYNCYYDYSRKTAGNESFVMFFSNEEGNAYDEFLRSYFKINADKSGTFMNFKDFDETQITRMLGRINYYLDPSEENVDLHISELPSEFYLVYENGRLVEYSPIKCTLDDLNTLYSK